MAYIYKNASIYFKKKFWGHFHRLLYQGMPVIQFHPNVITDLTPVKILGCANAFRRNNNELP